MLKHILRDEPEDNIPYLFSDLVYYKAFGIHRAYLGQGIAMTTRQMAFNYIISRARVKVKYLYIIIINN
jgi:hypothetical protein